MASLESRVEALEEQIIEQGRSKKVFLISHLDFKEKIVEIHQAKEEGFETFTICLVGPDDEKEDSDWGRFLRKEHE